MTPEVIVVDDKRALAEQVAEYLTARTKIEAVATTDPRIAASIVEAHLIKVAVLDQSMPIQSGTELFKTLKQISPRLRAIMLTGEAESREVGDALNLGFDHYVEKGDLERLADLVSILHAKYETDLAKALVGGSQPVVFKARPRFWVGHRRSYQLLSMNVLDEEYVVPGSWETIRQVSAGEEVKDTFTYRTDVKIEMEQESQHSLQSNLGLPGSAIQKFSLSLASTISSTFKDTFSVEAEQTRTREVSFKLPEEPADPGIVSIKARNYQQTQLFKRIQVAVGHSCPTCNAGRTIQVIFLQPLPKLSTRQEDYLSDGSKKTTPTGIINA